MPFLGTAYQLTPESIRQYAPTASGVYGVFTVHGGWVYIGESDNIRAELFQHLSDAAHSMHRYAPLGFVAESVVGSAVARRRRRNALIVECKIPPCNELFAED